MLLSKALPPLHGPVLERERLLARLLAWEDRKLVIIHGQAGQGKSTLAASYVRARSSPSVWYTLDREDATPAVFLAGLGRAIESIRKTALPPPPNAPQYRYGVSAAEANIAAWISTAFAEVMRPLLVVLDDDGSAAASPDLQALLGMLLDATPPQIRFLFLSRGKPALDLTKLRARQAVGELSGDDLRFSREEVFHLYTSVFGTRINREEADTVNRIAEGWPVGIVLLHEWLASSPRPASSLLAEWRRHPAVRGHVFDYLAQEVFDALPRGLQRFLLRTSIVEYLTPELRELLAGAPTGRKQGTTAAFVEDLRQRNLFMSSSDDDYGVIRYHPLFREFLLKRFSSEAGPREVKRLSGLAARHLEKSGEIVRSIDLYIASGQAEPATALIEKAGRDLIAIGRTGTLLRWRDELPRNYQARPWFVLFQAMALRFTDSRAALTLFERALAGFNRSGDNRSSAEGMSYALAGIIEACFYSGEAGRRMQRAAELTERLLERKKTVTAGARARLLLALGIARFFSGSLRESSDVLSRALALFRHQGDCFSQIQSAIYLAPCGVYLGDFVLARDAVRQGFEALKHIPEEKGGEAALFTVQAMTALNEGKFDEARECLGRCGALAREHGLEAFDFLSLTIGGWVMLALGEHEEAGRSLAECRHRGHELKNAFFIGSAAHLLSLNELHRGRIARARAEADASLRPSPWSASRLFRATSLAASGAISLKQGELARAGRELRTSLAALHEIGAAQQEANVRLLLAALALRTGKDNEARELLQAGFGIGQERGFFYYGTIGADDLRELAERARDENICPEYCGTLLREHLAERTAPAVRVQLFGEFAVFRGKDRITDAEWKSPRAKTLVKLLAAHGDRGLARDQAADILWQGSGGGNQGFTSLLHRVRRTLGAHPDTVRLEGEQLVLDRRRVSTDISEFQRRLRTAGNVAVREEHDEALKHYRKAFELYQGDLLSDDLYDEWTVPHRERFRGLYQKALLDAAVLTERLKRPDETAMWYGKLFENDPCSEKACRWLMAHHVANGRRAEAVRAYEQCQRALERELETEPEEETRKVYRRIIGG